MEAINEGCHSYVAKPINAEGLLKEIQTLGVLPQPAEAIPSRDAPNHEDAAPANLERSRQDVDASLRFLIVDDDLSCRELMKQLLSPYGQCDEARDGDEALDAIQLSLEDGLPYDLACLDIMMPGKDGHQTLAGIRALEKEHGVWGSAGLKVIMTTALRDSKHCLQAFREGCESYLTKPIDETELFEQLRALGFLEKQPA